MSANTPKVKSKRTKQSLAGKYAHYLQSLPPSDRQISNRMFKRFCWAFFVHTALTAILMLVGKLVTGDWGTESILGLYEKALVVYTPVFTAFLTKNTIENHAKITSAVGTTTSPVVDVEVEQHFSGEENENSTTENG